MAPQVRQDADLTKVMLHHTQTDATILGADLNKRAVSNAQFGVPYDILINNDGKLDLGPRWIFAVDPKQYLADVSVLQIKRYNVHYLSQASEDSELNRIAIHVALVGDFDGASPSAAQYATLLSLLQYLKKTYPINEVVYHGDTSQTSCPGMLFFSKASLDIADTSPTSFPTPQFELLRPENTFQILPRFTPPIPQQRSTTRSMTIGIAAPKKFYDVSGGVPPPPLKWLFVGVGTVISVVDVSIPTAPVFMGVTYSGMVNATAINFQPIADSQYFYYVTATATSRNVWIFDWATNPAAITRIGMFTDINQWFVEKAIKLGTNRLVCPSIIATTMVGTLGITNPAVPTLLSVTTGGATIKGTGGGAIANNTLWAAFAKSGANGLYSVPLTEPIGPATFRVNDSNLAGATVIIGNYLWVASTAGATGFTIFSINPFSAISVGTYSISPFSVVTAPLLRGNYLFISLNDGATKHGFQIVDVTNPAVPVFVATSPAVTLRDGTGGTSIVVHDNYVYYVTRVTGNNICHLLVFDISTITSPVLVADIDVSSGQNPVAGHCWAYPNEGNDGGNMVVV